MRSEAEIRREVETRLRRRGLLLLHGGLLASAMFVVYIRHRLLGELLATYTVFFFLGWMLLVGLHAFRVFYVEMRERLVRSAIERERQFYLLRDNYEKQKRSGDRDVNAVMHLSDDGELVDAPDERKVKASYER